MIKRLTRFSESFDSVRHAPDLTKESDYLTDALMHCRIETLISLLFGEQILIPEPYSFDSIGFVEVATEVIRSRKRLLANPETRNILARTPVYYPFALSLLRFLPNHDSFRGITALRFGNEKFILSSQPEISEQYSRRRKASEIFQNSDKRFTDAVVHLGEARRTYLEKLDDLNDYFSSTPDIAVGSSPLVGTRRVNTVQKYVDKLVNLSLRTIPGENVDEVLRIRNTFSVLQAKGVPLDDRSQIRLQGPKFVNSEADYKLSLEFIDSAYNRVLAKSSMAKMRSHNTGLRGFQEDVLVGEELSQLVQNRIGKRKITSEPTALILEPSDNLKSIFNSTTEKQITQYVTTDWDSIWDAMWQVIASPKWAKSIEGLHLGLKLNSENDEEKRAEIFAHLDRHIKVVTEAISPFLIQHQGNGILKFVGPVTHLGLFLCYIFGLHLPHELHFIPGVHELHHFSQHNYNKWISRGEVETSLRESIYLP